MTVLFIEITEKVVLAVLGGVFALLLELARRQNSRQHGEAISGINDIKADMRDVKADVRDVKSDVRDVGYRMDDLKAIEANHHEENIVRLEAIDGRVTALEGDTP